MTGRMTGRMAGWMAGWMRLFLWRGAGGGVVSGYLDQDEAGGASWARC